MIHENNYIFSADDIILTFFDGILFLRVAFNKYYLLHEKKKILPTGGFFSYLNIANLSPTRKCKYAK